MKRAAKLASTFAAIAATFLALHLFMASQLELEDALFLTKNTFREWNDHYLCKGRVAGCTLPEGKHGEDKHEEEEIESTARRFDLDLDSPFTNVVNLVFPIDLIVSYNASNITHKFVARYASFSPVLTGKLRSHFSVFPGDACEPIVADDYPDMKDRVIVVLRGHCTFVSKVKHVLESKLRPRAVVVANNEPSRNLITMYSGTFNSDGLLSVPVLFIASEDYLRLQEVGDVELLLQTAAFDNWVNLMLLMAVSPPLLILACYVAVRGIQLCRRRRRSVVSRRLVRRLPVYIYNKSHLVPAGSFYEYLAATGQTDVVSLPLSSFNDILGDQPDLVHEVDLESVNVPLLMAPKDFYPTKKCSICLDRFVALHLRVLVLDCHHVYHEKCLSNWLVNFRRTCPLCNEPLKLIDTLPLLDISQLYGSFSGDLERNSSYSDRVFSTTAVRSLQLDPIRTGGQESHMNESGTVQSIDIESAGHTMEQQTRGELRGPDATLSATSESSFITTQTHLDSVSSQYHTPRQSLEQSSDDGTELLLASSNSTIRDEV